MAEVKEHIIRVPLPWRSAEAATTECGLPAASYPSLTAEQMEAKVKREGEQRASYSSCMTCWTTRRNRRWNSRSDNLLDVFNREILRVSHGGDAGSYKRLEREVRAMVMLVEAHREEFDGILADMGEAIDLTAVSRRAKVKPGVLATRPRLL